MRFQVALNGTSVNPFERLGLKVNPFPAIPKAEYESVNDTLRDLEARPIKDSDDIRTRLQGWSDEFIQGCVDRFIPGEMVKFMVDC